MEGELYCCSSALVFKPTWGRRHPDKNINYNYRIVIVHLISSPPWSSHAEESLHNTKYPVFRSRTRSRLSVWVFCRPAPAQQLPVAGCMEARLAASTRLVPSLLIWPPPACCDHTLASWMGPQTNHENLCTVKLYWTAVFKSDRISSVYIVSK